MSAFKQKARSLAVRAGLIAGASAAVLAISGVGASSAFATECPTNPLEIEGKGASLQRVAQGFWTGREVPSNEIKAVPHTKLTPEKGYALGCGSAPVSYTSTGSGPGLAAFGFTGSGKIENGTNAGETHTMSFVGSDDGPTKAQLETGEALTSGGVASGASAIVVPVAETSIAVIYNPPENCTLTNNTAHGITWAELNKVFGGVAIKKFSELTHASPTGAGCSTEPLTRVVRAEGSGTTYQFKNYLSVLEGKGGPEMPCKVVGQGGTETKKWANMRPIEGEEKPNKVWPTTATCVEATTTTPVATGAGGGAIVKYVAEHKGTIGYAALPDVQSSNNVGGAAKVAFLQDAEEEGEALFGGPEAGSGGGSNCGTRVYTVPAEGRTTGTGETVDWSGVFGAEPAVGSSLFPLCALTYDVAWGTSEVGGSGYSKAGYTEATNRAENVKKYLHYVVTEGQSIGNGYQALPTGSGAASNVKAAAEYAVTKIR